MGTRTYATTNERLHEALEIVTELIDWAEADFEHAEESDAPDTAEDDRQRVRLLKQARKLLMDCER